MAAVMAARPPTTPPALGAVRKIAGALFGLTIGERAFHTATDCGGSVTLTRPKRSERTAPVVP